MYVGDAVPAAYGYAHDALTRLRKIRRVQRFGGLKDEAEFGRRLLEVAERLGAAQSLLVQYVDQMKDDD